MVCLLALHLFLTAMPVQAEQDLTYDERELNQPEQKEPTKLVKSGDDMVLFKFYRNYISPADGDRCGMYPSCSSYGEQAVKKHGFFMGWIMACDRLIRCGRDELHISPSVKSYVETVKYDQDSNPKESHQLSGKLLTIDPVEANDFWWYHYVQ